MAEQTFSSEFRHALWKTYGCACFYGKELISLEEMEVDHLVPESLAKDEETLKVFLAENGLAWDFDVRGASNLVPSCGAHNLRKSNKKLPPGAMAIFLMQARAKAPAVEAEERVLVAGKTLGQLVGQLYLAHRKGKFTRQQLREMLVEKDLITLDFATTAVPAAAEFEVRFAAHAVSRFVELGLVVADLEKAIRLGSLTGSRLKGLEGDRFVIKAGRDLRIVASIVGEVLIVLSVHRHA